MNNLLYDKLNFTVTNYETEQEGQEYSACRFKINELNIIGRKAKITPKKVGQFVTCWKRDEAGITTPFHETDPFNFYVIDIVKGIHRGQFVFPKSILIKFGIVSTNEKDGKRGFRLYPSWDSPTSKQAQRSQEWQLKYFARIDKKKELDRIRSLYANE